MIRSTVDHLKRKNTQKFYPLISTPDGVIFEVLSLKYQVPKTTHPTPAAGLDIPKDLISGSIVRESQNTNHIYESKMPA